MLGFFLSFAATLIAPVLYPSSRLLFFAPTLIFCLYKNSLITSLWMAFISGLILDILTPGHRLGLLALNFTLTILILFQLKLYFFSERMSTLPVMTFLFAAIAALLHLFLNTIFQANLLHVFEIPLTGSWILYDLILRPAWDALFAFASLFVWNLLFSNKQKLIKL